MKAHKFRVKVKVVVISCIEVSIDAPHLYKRKRIDKRRNGEQDTSCYEESVDGKARSCQISCRTIMNESGVIKCIC